MLSKFARLVRQVVTSINVISAVIVPSLARAKWLQQRQAELLPVPYFHVFFTVPEQITALALQNKQFIYSILFEAVLQTLLKIARLSYGSRHRVNR